MKIAVMAAGSWGTALSMVLHDNAHDVCVWARNREQVASINATHINHKYLKDIEIPKEITFTNDMKACIEGAKVILFSVPTQQLSHVLNDMMTQIEKEAIDIPEDTIMINVSKGIEIGSLRIPSQWFEAVFPQHPFVVLSGPSHAEEVALKLPTALVSASQSKEAAEFVQDLFANDYMRIYTNPDVVGVELSGALKNIIALGAGISDGLGYGDNAKAALITRGISEITQLGIKMGANLSTFKGLAGVGDMIVTCTSQHSRNRRCGILIGQGMPLDEAIKEIGMVVEGAYTVKSAFALKEKYHIEMPITTALYEVLYHHQNAREQVNQLMTRQKKHEIDESVTLTNQWQ